MSLGSAGTDPRRSGGAVGAVADATRPRRVLCVFGSFERAGAQLRTLEVLRELRRDRLVQFAFCSLDLGPDEVSQDVAEAGGSVHRVSIRSPRFLVAFPRLLRRGRYDVVHTEPQFLSGIVVWLAALCRVPVRIVAIHNSVGDAGQTARKRWVRLVLANRVFLWSMRTLTSRYATNVIAVSASALDSVLPGRWQARRDCRVVYNGTDLGPFRRPEDRVGVRREFGWPDDARIVVNVGRLSTQKNHPVILEAIRRLREEDPRVRLLLVGGGKLRDRIEELVDRLGLRDACAIVENRPDVPRLLLASDVFFFPSAWEGLPGSPLEALAAGLPIVSSDIPPMLEISPHFPGSILVAPPDDVEAHVEHLRAALRMPRERERVQERFAGSPFALPQAVVAYRGLYRVRGPAPAPAEARA